MLNGENSRYPSLRIFSLLMPLGMAVLFQLFFAQRSCSEDWPVFQRDAAHSGHNRTDPAKMPFEKNSVSIGAAVWGFASPVISSGVVYFGTLSGEVMARQFPGGALLWKINIGAPMYLAPAVADGKLIFGSADGYLAAVEAATGKYLWSIGTGSNINASPVAAGNKVIAVTNSGHIFAVELATGNLIWKKEIPGNKGGYSLNSPAFDGLRIYGASGNSVFALDIETGNTLWVINTSGYYNTRTAPTLSDGKVFVGTEGSMQALRADTGAFLWNASVPGGMSVNGSLAAADGRVYFGSNDADFYALNSDDGSVVWKFKTDDSIYSSPVLVQNFLLIASNDRKLYALERSSGALLASYSAGGRVASAMAFSNGSLAAISDAGTLEIFRPTNAAPSAPDGLLVNGETAPFVTTSAVAFSWNFSDPDPGDFQSGFRLQLSTMPGGFSAPFFDSGYISSIEPGYLLGELDYSSTFYWRVQVGDSFGTIGPFSGGSAVFVYDPKPPSVNFISPRGGEVFIEGFGKISVIVEVRDVMDPAPSAETAFVQVEDKGRPRGGVPARVAVSSFAAVDPLELDDGLWRLEVAARDYLGNSTIAYSGIFEVAHDTVAPVTELLLAGTTGQNGWYVSPVSVTLVSTDAVSGVSGTYYAVDDSSFAVYAGSFTVSMEGVHVLKYYSVDAAGNKEAENVREIKTDGAGPATYAVIKGAPAVGPAAYLAGADTVAFTAYDAGSGAAATYYTVDVVFSTTTALAYSAPFALAIGTHTLYYRSVDNLGNSEAVKTLAVTVDTLAPVTRCYVNGVLASSAAWTGHARSGSSITLEGVETPQNGSSSGLAYTLYDLDKNAGGAWADLSGGTYSGPLVFNSEGGYRLTYRSMDNAGNLESQKTRERYIDGTAPVTAVLIHGTTVAAESSVTMASYETVTLSASDPVSNGVSSGLSGIFYTLDAAFSTAAALAYSVPFMLNPGTHTLYYMSVDNVGNAEAVKRVTIISTPLEAVYLRSIGGYGTEKGRFSAPVDVGIGPWGSALYVTDSLNFRVQKFTLDGRFLLSFGSFGSGPGQFGGPIQTAVAPASGEAVREDYIYVADPGNYRVQRFGQGGGYMGSSGSRGSGPGQFEAVTWVAADFYNNGLVYVSDALLNRVQAFNRNGEYQYTIGAGYLSSPGALAVWNYLDGQGRWQSQLYVLDRGNGRVAAFRGGVLVGAQSGDFGSAAGIHADASGRIYVSDERGWISVYNSSGAYAGRFGQGGPDALEFSRPMGMATDPAGYLYVADSLNDRVQKIHVPGADRTPPAAAGGLSVGYVSPYYARLNFTAAGDDGMSGRAAWYDVRYSSLGAINTAQDFEDAAPSYLPYTPAAPGVMERLFAGGLEPGNAYNLALRIYDDGGNYWQSPSLPAATPARVPEGDLTRFAGFPDQSAVTGNNGNPAITAQLGLPAALAADAPGYLYIAAAMGAAPNSVVRKVNPANAVITMPAGGTSGSGYGGDGGPGNQATLNRPGGVAADRQNNLLIADTANNRIRKLTAATGLITTIAGNGTAGYAGDGGPAPAAALKAPRGISVDAQGDIYFADSGNNAVRRIRAADGVIETVAGTGAAGYSGDGGAAPAALLNGPSDARVDASGDIYITDAGNNRIRRVAAGSGIITTIAGTGAAASGGENVPAVSSPLNVPGLLAVDPVGNIYAPERAGHRVRKIDRSGLITTVAGTGVPGNTASGPAALLARLSTPTAAAGDWARGVLYIADDYRVSALGIKPYLTAASTASAGGKSEFELVSTGVYAVNRAAGGTLAEALAAAADQGYGPAGPVYEVSPAQAGAEARVTFRLAVSAGEQGLLAIYCYNDGQWDASKIVSQRIIRQGDYYELSGIALVTSLFAVLRDAVPPVTSASSAGTRGLGDWYISTVTVTLSASDAVSGSSAAYYSLDGAAFTLYTGGIMVSSEGPHLLNYYSVDKAGNVEAAKSAAFKIDLSAPSVSITAAPVPNAAGWNNGPVAVATVGTDTVSGIAYCEPEKAISIEGGGRAVSGYCADYAGNSSTATLTLNIDRTRPVINISSPAAGQVFIATRGRIEVKFDATDNLDPAPRMEAVLTQVEDRSGPRGNRPDRISVANGAGLEPLDIDDGLWRLLVSATDFADNPTAAEGGTFEVIHDILPPRTELVMAEGLWLKAEGMTYIRKDTELKLSSLDDLVQAGDGIGLGVVKQRIEVRSQNSESRRGVFENPESGQGKVFISTFSFGADWPLPDGWYSLGYSAEDVLGNAEAAKTSAFAVDNTSPITELTANGTWYAVSGNSYTNSGGGIALSAVDISSGGAASGLKGTSYNWDNGGWLDYSTGLAIASLGEGGHIIAYYSADNLGNSETPKSYSFMSDFTPPRTTFALSGPLYIKDGLRYIAPSTELVFTAEDAVSNGVSSGVGSVEAAVDGGQFAKYTQALRFAEGRHTIKYRAIDNVGNTEPEKTLEVYSDDTPPVTELAVSGARYSVSGEETVYITGGSGIILVSSDPLNNELASGVLLVKYRLDGGDWQVYSDSFSIADEGPHTLEYYALDRVQNLEIQKTAKIAVDNTPPATAISLGEPKYEVFGLPVLMLNTPITLSAGDPVVNGISAGLNSIFYEIENARTGARAPIAAYASPFTLPEQGTFIIRFWSKDNVNNVETAKGITASVTAWREDGLTAVSGLEMSGTADISGTVKSNAVVSLGGNARILGDVTASTITLSGKAQITGRKISGAVPVNPAPLELAGIIQRAAAANNNALVSQYLVDGKLMPGSKAEIVLSTGTYYFKGMELSGGSGITIAGPVEILVEGDITINGGSSLNASGAASSLSIIVSTASGLKFTGGAAFAGCLYAPYSDLKLTGNALLGGHYFVKTAALSGTGNFIQSGETLPQAATAPPDGGGKKKVSALGTAAAGATVLAGPDPEFRLGEVYVFPNPAKAGARPAFHVETGIADSVKLIIYTVSGNVAHERTITGAPTALDDGNGLSYAYEYVWDGHIPSGVYYFVMEAEKAGKKLKKTGKFAVVR